MNITLLGFGISNKAILNCLKGKHDFFVSDINLKDEDIRLLESVGVGYETSHTGKILDSDIVVVSPGISPHSGVGKMVRNSKVESVVDIDFYFRINKKPPLLIGVTGTNGKTTTASMICHVIRDSGRDCAFLGNNESPVFSFEGETEVMVLELSSFQLYWAQKIPLDIGVLLNISPDHLDWHESYEEYLEAKKKILAFSKVKLISREVANLGFCKDAIVFNEDIVDLDKFPEKLKSAQNLQNVAAAFAVAREIGIESKEFYKSLSKFEVPPHRMEFVAEYRGVKFYEDSKATNTYASMKALENFDKVVLILSGIVKEKDLGDFVKVVEEKAEKVILLGDRIREKLDLKNMDVEFARSMDEAVRKAFEGAKSGIVLFSPAGASFDMYKNYKERGKDFKRAVRRLMEDG
ncbi:MAG: UDP-N-acetylmuramoyl-L-alanine--D-glutamate ligase [Thermotogaceae bacterium]|nr:UDP-N-acetylmuramoyl-L-alanine--D-glutamate ligase [Thermotogaceae bacterium]